MRTRHLEDYAAILLDNNNLFRFKIAKKGAGPSLSVNLCQSKAIESSKKKGQNRQSSIKYVMAVLKSLLAPFKVVFLESKESSCPLKSYFSVFFIVTLRGYVDF